MACLYANNGNQATTSSSNKTMTSIASIAGLRPQIYEFTVGADGAPNATDCSLVITLQGWTSSAGTSTSFTPFPLDVGYQAAKASCGINHSGEPTYTAGSTYFGPMGMNQRATYRWVAAPGSNIVLVGTATTGAGMQVKSSNYTGQTDCIIYTQE